MRLFYLFIFILVWVVSMSIATADVKHQVGGGIYASSIKNSGKIEDFRPRSTLSDDKIDEVLNLDVFGVAAFGTFVINDNFGIRGLIGGGGSEDISSIILEGTALLGTGLGTEGPKFYIGPGYASDNMGTGQDSDVGSTNIDEITSAHLMLGTGYNFESVAVDGWLAIRDDSAYDDVIPGTDEVYSYVISVSGLF
ncbi:hypothetical protein [Halorhodospira halochloris]|uniref:hypothetical protein n=1 Tax=Halorhodospira halochloris TaxID=1052 RepID=UPI001EE86181|nr:hypothetical protein [Halorhodospira halochloris]MCG5548214.1 hypothetical protein [Halorhodospira halochloris]